MHRGTGLLPCGVCNEGRCCLIVGVAGASVGCEQVLHMHKWSVRGLLLETCGTGMPSVVFLLLPGICA